MNVVVAIRPTASVVQSGGIRIHVETRERRFAIVGNAAGIAVDLTLVRNAVCVAVATCPPIDVGRVVDAVSVAVALVFVGTHIDDAIDDSLIAVEIRKLQGGAKGG